MVGMWAYIPTIVKIREREKKKIKNSSVTCGENRERQQIPESAFGMEMHNTRQQVIRATTIKKGEFFRKNEKGKHTDADSGREKKFSKK